ncbi:drug metabolite transporter superfamily [Blastocystis sp. subtype 4]|uniref:drug metabolite transporter superfamily n=1 Tax=Blastocystis sp. subtype 4 TaxID=944170 RepID=UPI00071179B2|nr:drug metabolite transporter superfamily [Blastocystis sp. subtype 4]KNB45194.1 drug metabolite transporter superfamily [Blastocystis sp. subtype 4]|eukprot:XP_014528637.1 drug metabolite transporter superfamily [Blastocystis sp. subtype 4]
MGDPESGGANNSDDIDVNVKYSMDPSKRRNHYMYLCKITLAVGVWYLSSIMATVVNKTLVSGQERVLPLTLTFAHVFISSCCDIVNMTVFHRHEMRFCLKNLNLWITVRYIFPLAIAMVATKLLTYISYAYIPASLTHTVKALQPFFNVLIVYLWTGEGVDNKTILTLFPIVFGVVYASVNELESCFCSFVMMSTIVGVWQSVYLKMLMRLGLEKNFVTSLDKWDAKLDTPLSGCFNYRIF